LSVQLGEKVESLYNNKNILKTGVLPLNNYKAATCIRLYLLMCQIWLIQKNLVWLVNIQIGSICMHQFVHHHYMWDTNPFKEVLTAMEAND